MEGSGIGQFIPCLLYTSPSPRDYAASRMPSSAWKKKQEHEFLPYEESWND